MTSSIWREPERELIAIPYDWSGKGNNLAQGARASIYKATDNISAIEILLGHSKIENTVRNLGVDIEDALTLAKKTEIALRERWSESWVGVSFRANSGRAD